ncbi:MAG: MBOAT family protein, partial [Planctomycetota bacterium]|nr:MBOAT family protein [Planctomycetota bacterium]
MTFNSLGFLLFFTVVLAVDLLLRHQGRGRKPFLLIASWFFYACWDWRFLALILFSTGLDFLVGTKIHGTENPKRRRAWLYASLVGNLGILGTFKYY